MPSPAELQKLLEFPNESLSAEYKDWLRLSEPAGRATLAKAAIALANHGGGVIVLGMRKNDETGLLVSHPRPDEIPRYNQDDINSAINQYADPEIHCELSFAADPGTGVEHAFVGVPSGTAVPIMTARDCASVIGARKCYIRKPGPRSEEPFTSEEWRTLLDRCVRAGRESLLEAIRAILQGSAGTEPAPAATQALESFAERARARWSLLVEALPSDDPARFPYGRYELDFEILLGAAPVPTLAELRSRMEAANSIKLTGWGPFVMLTRPEYQPQVVSGAIQAWLGRANVDRVGGRLPAHCDFWRADPTGRLALLRGYDEDGARDRGVEPGTAFDITLPVWRVGEAVLFVQRLADTFGADLSFIVRCRYLSLRGRKLVHLAGTRILLNDYRSEDDDVQLQRQTSAAEVRDNLAEVMRELLTPLYERFSFFQLSPKLVSEELTRMLSGRF